MHVKRWSLVHYIHQEKCFLSKNIQRKMPLSQFFWSAKDCIQINLHRAIRSFIQMKPKKEDSWCKPMSWYIYGKDQFKWKYALTSTLFMEQMMSI